MSAAARKPSSKALAPAEIARKREIGRIHILKDQLGLDRDQYEAVLASVCGPDVESSTQLDAPGRLKLIRHLEAHRARQQPVYPGRPHNTDAKARKEITKIQALLTDAGRPWTYAQSILTRMTKGRKTRIEFASLGELNALITALEVEAKKRLATALLDELRRHGLDWSYAITAAVLMFGLSPKRDLTKYSEPMSQTLRWLRGDLRPAPACPWPWVDPKARDQPRTCREENSDEPNDGPAANTSDGLAGWANTGDLDAQ